MRNYLSLILSLSVSKDARESLLEILRKHPEGHLDPNIRSQFADLLEQYSHDEKANGNDVLYLIGLCVYGINVQSPLPMPSSEEVIEEEDPGVIVGFDFMDQFMTDVFLSYGGESSLLSFHRLIRPRVNSLKAIT